MVNPFFELLAQIINLYSIALFIWIVLSWLAHFNIVNRHHPLVYRVQQVLDRIIEPVLRPIRRVLPDTGGVDLSPILLILGLQFLKNSLYYYG